MAAWTPSQIPTEMWSKFGKPVNVWNGRTTPTNVWGPPHIVMPSGPSGVSITVLDGVPIGRVVGEFIVTGGAGTYTFAFNSNPGALFAISGNQIQVNNILPLGETTVIVHADNGVGSTADQSFTFDVISTSQSWVPGLRPFRSDSAANQVLPVGSIYTQVNWPPNFDTDPSTGFQNYFFGNKFNLDNPSPDETTVCSFLAPNSWGNPTQIINQIMTSGFSGRTGDPDNEGASMSGTICTSLYNFTRTSDAAATCGGYAFCDILDDTGFGDPSTGHGAGVVATGSSMMLGSMLKEEFTRYGAFNHWIGFNVIVSLCAPGFTLPAISGDGGSSNGLFCEGTLLAIPATTPVPDGLSVYGLALFNTLRDYGAWAFDQGGSFGPYGCHVTSNPSGSWSDADIPLVISDINLLWPLLYKIGPPLDGILVNLSAYSVCAPQLQTAAYAGALLSVTRDSDSMSLDIGKVNLPSHLLDATSMINFCAGTVGRVSKYYNQITGHADFISAGAAAPIIVQSGAAKVINSVPAMLFDGTSNYLKATGSSSIYPGSQVYLNAIVQIADHAAGYAVFGSDASGGLELRIDTSTGFVHLLNNTGTSIGVSATAVAVNTPTLIEASYVPGTGVFKIWQGGTQTATGTNIVSVASGNVLLGRGSASSTDYFKGLIGAFMVTSLMPSNPQFSVANGLKNFWGA